MPQSLAALYTHVVFSTLDRRPFLLDPEMRSETHRFPGGVAKNLGCFPFVVGGVEDHVHLLVNLGRTVTIADLVKELKRSSSTWIKTNGVDEFAWQSGYGAFSVSRGDLDVVRRYIENQEEHHKSLSFQEEFLGILKEHDLTWDERYLWD